MRGLLNQQPLIRHKVFGFVAGRELRSCDSSPISLTASPGTILMSPRPAPRLLILATRPR